MGNLVGLDWGYKDEIVERFSRETGLKPLAPNASGPEAMKRRYEWLTTEAKSEWIAWRCNRISELIAKMASRVRQARPDLVLFLHVFPTDETRPYSPGDTPRTRLQAAGIDPMRIKEIPGVALIDSSADYGRNIPKAVDLGLLQATRDPRIVTSLRIDGMPARFISPQRYIELTGDYATPTQLRMPATTAARWTSLAANPPGYQALERFASELAEADAIMLGDGGNGNVFSTPELAAFVAAFTRLPDLPFKTLTPSDAPIVLRSIEAHDASAKEGSWLYAVNRTSSWRDMDLHLAPAATIVDAYPPGTLVGIPRANRLHLPPFSLFVGRVSTPGATFPLAQNTSQSLSPTRTAAKSALSGLARVTDSSNI